MNRTALITALVLAGSASAYQLKQDSTGTSVRWNGPVGFVVDAKLGDTLKDPAAVEAVKAAVKSFETTLPNVELTVTAGKTSGIGFDRSGGKNQNEIVALEDWPFDENFIAATVVTMNARTHEILDADIALNARSHKFKVLPAHANGGSHDDIQNTVTHELGHALGLAHNPEVEHAVMFPSAKPGEVQKRELSDDDRDGLFALYGSAAAPLQPESASVASGCSSTSSQPSSLGLLVLALLAAVRKSRKGTKAAAAAVLVLSSSAVMAAGIRPTAKVTSARAAYTAEVRSIRPLPPQGKLKLMMSEVSLTVRNCLKGECPKEVTVVVPGGKSGDVEQVVMGRPIPSEGDVMGVTVSDAPASPLAGLATGVRSVSSSSTSANLYRLSEPEDFQAFAAGLSDSKTP